MRQGSGRFGIDFEAKAREFVAKYGFDLISENEVINCVEKSHQKPSHEIDFITGYSGNARTPLPPLYGFKKKFIVSCKGGKALDQGEVTDASNQLECVRNDPRFSDVEGCVVICETKQPHLKIPSSIKVWDSTYMHLMGEKMRVAQRVINSKSVYSEVNLKQEGLTAIWQINTSTDLNTKQVQIFSEINIFNEDPTKTVGKTEIMEILSNSFTEEADKKVNVSKFIKIYSASGIRTDLQMLVNKFDPVNPTYVISKITDLSIATWTLYLEDGVI